jgi:hypothetical protein
MSQNDEQRFVTPEFAANYVYLDERKVPKDQGDGSTQKPYWCLTFKAPQDNPIWDELNEKIEVALVNKFGEVPKKWRTPIKNGDEWEDETFHGCFVLEMKSQKRKPGVKVYNPDGANEDVTDYDGEVYSGMVCVATARMGAYDNVSKGVNAYLNNVLKIEDGERIGGTTASAEADFEGYVPGGAGKPKASSKKKKTSSRSESPLD